MFLLEGRLSRREREIRGGSEGLLLAADHVITSSEHRSAPLTIIGTEFVPAAFWEGAVQPELVARSLTHRLRVCATPDTLCRKIREEHAAAAAQVEPKEVVHLVVQGNKHSRLLRNMLLARNNHLRGPQPLAVRAPMPQPQDVPHRTVPIPHEQVAHPGDVNVQEDAKLDIASQNQNAVQLETPLPVPSSDADYQSIKVFRQDESNEPKLDGVASFNYEFYGHLLAPSSDADYHIVSTLITIVSKYSSRGIKRAQTRWGWVVNYEFLWPPSSSIIRPWLPYSISKYSSRRIKRAQTRWGCRLITEFLATFQPIIRPCYHSIKVLVKTNQTSPNSMGLRRLITEFLWPPSGSIIRR
ncbi:hypothetical protein EVAR_99851_1 [Eumeta japonica]|uniref:Uncharacterized protein n=1 Tax=Eumeta variegata TaxID=151549 RepID=A0A4C2A7U7_EUMVA|nr:hypothetical protein EVAR_99851_1 [Eumeta japonica]